MTIRFSLLMLLCILVMPAAAFEVPPSYQPFILDAHDNRKSWLQMLCETYSICDKSRANRSLAIVIGVSKYEHLKDLETTGNDAQQLANFLLESGEFDQVVLLREVDATEDTIEWFMETYFPEMLKDEPNSRFLFYFSGHGEFYEATGRGYLRLADNFRYRYDGSIAMDAVATWAQRNTRNAIHSLFLIDACVSGIAGLETMGDDDKHRFPARDPNELIQESAGWLITAGKGRQKAWADMKWGGSLFNYALMEGLKKGRADRQDSDGIITSLELYDYIDAVVRSETPMGKKQTPQRWRFRPGSGDFFFKSPLQQGIYLTQNPAVPAEPMGARSTQVNKMLRECQAHFEANRLTTGRSGTAADCYEEVLRLDRGNPKALEGLTAIENRYRGWAEKALQQGRLERASGYIEKIELFNPEGDAVYELKEHLRRAEKGEKPAGAPVIRETVKTKPEKSHPLVGEMIAIEGGCFQMGSPAGETGRYNDETQHRVCVDDFKIGKYEVTVEQFRRFVQATDYRTDAETNAGDKNGCYALDNGEWVYTDKANWRKTGFSQSERDPVVCVSWNDALAFVDWLNDETAGGYRLPKEAEWEYAARAKTKTARFWGEGPKEACNYANVHDNTSKRVNEFSWEHHDCDDGHAKTAPVGSFKPNGYDLFDMLGNALEWTCSAYDKEYGGDEKRCADRSDSGRRVLRGGSWGLKPGFVRSADRYAYGPGGRSDLVGFRLSQD